jgi:hypothetical protein
VTTTATSFNGKFGSDDVTIAAVTGNFTDKNVGNRKNINITGITLGGSAAGNYQLTSTTARTSADITRLNTVTWTGGSTGNWFDPANWAGGAVPDLSNVANVVIPGGVAVSFGSAVVAPAQSGAVNIDSLSGSGGTLSQTAGTLNVGTGGATLGGLTQSGGNITLMGPLTVSQGFSQDNAGAIIVGGSTSITDTSGGVQLGNLSSTGPLTVNSTDGAITQPAGTVNTAYGTSSFTATQGTNPAMPADIALTNAGNDFVGRVNASGSNVTLNDKNSLALGTLSTTGNLNLVSNGALELGTSTVAGTLNAKSGNGAITQTGVINVVGLATFDAGSGEITLTNPDNRFPQGTKIIAASSVIAGDAQAESQAAFKQVLDAMPKTTLPGVNSFSLAAPAPLVMSSVTPTTSQSGSTSSTTATAGGGNSAGVSIDVDRAPATQAVMMAAVSLPKGTSTAGAGFSFELPETVRSLAQAGLIAKATQLDGTSLPAWLRFNAESLRFEAAAVPDGAFPLQVVVLISGQRVLVVISERNT